LIPFVKAHGNGNDFIIIEDEDGRYDDLELVDLARKVCRRRVSLGADGLLVLGSSKDFDFSMRLFNADGSEGEMCGNGARCIARYAFERGHAKSDMTFETKAGPVSAQVSPPFVTIGMGRIDLKRVKRAKIKAFERDVTYIALHVGVPHCVLFMDGFYNISRDELLQLARSLRKEGVVFDEGANVNFVEVKENHLIAMTYERGVEDFTLSCGTGAIACSLASHLLCSTPLSIDVKNPGGINRVTLEIAPNDTAEASLTGKALIVATGNLTEEALMADYHWR